MGERPFIVGIGGTTRAGSATETALALALESARADGAETAAFCSEMLLALPHYMAPGYDTCSAARELVDAVRRADGLIIASPGYHGTISGLVKNAIDYFEELSKDERTYIDGIPVGLIVTAYGWQATGSTLATLRSLVHALRGFPTPLGAGINCSGGILSGGKCSDPTVAKQLTLIGKQVVSYTDRTVAVQ